MALGRLAVLWARLPQHHRRERRCRRNPELLGPAHGLRHRTPGSLLPAGAWPSAFGSNVRVALQGGYVNATADQSSSATSDRNIGELLNGQLLAQCGACTLTSQLATRHEAWWLAATATSDIRIGVVTLSPLAEILGVSREHDRTCLSRAIRSARSRPTTRRPACAGLMSARDSGVTCTVPLAAAVEAGLGGKVGFAHRQVSLTEMGCSCRLASLSAPLSSSVTQPLRSWRTCMAR